MTMTAIYAEQDFSVLTETENINGLFYSEPIEMVVYKYGIIFNHPSLVNPKYLNDIGNYEVSRIYIEEEELDYSVTNKTRNIYYLTNNTSNIPILPVYFTSLFSLNKYVQRNKYNLNKIYGKWNKDLWYMKATNSIYVSSSKKR